MPDVKSALQSEIRRLAKKEAKALLASAEKKIKELNSTVKANKKTIREMRRTLDKVTKKVVPKKKIPVSKEKLDKSRLSPKMIVSLRKRLGISQDELAKIIGASPNAIYKWEAGRSKPRKEFKAHIIELRNIGKREVQKRLEEVEAQNQNLAQ